MFMTAWYGTREIEGFFIRVIYCYLFFIAGCMFVFKTLT